MFKMNLSLMLICSLLFSLALAPAALANTKAEKEALFAAKVKAGIVKLGVGPDARLTVKLRDKTKLSGYVSQIGDASFVATDAKSGAATEVAYSDVTQVKGNNLSTGAWIAIGALAAAGILIALILVGLHNN